MHVPYWGEQREMKGSMAKKKGNARFQIHLVLPSLLSPNSKSYNLKKALRFRTIFQSKWQCWGPAVITLLPFFAVMRSHFLVFCMYYFQLLFQSLPLSRLTHKHKFICTQVFWFHMLNNVVLYYHTHFIDMESEA